jgi:hypothetical protein
MLVAAMHLDLRLYLEQAAQTHAADPLGYLWEFGPVYAWWRRERAKEAQSIGFLTFHRLVIQSFRRTFPGGWIPVQPASMLPFPSLLADRAGTIRDLPALKEYSTDLEGWHHGVHRAIGDSFGTPERNVCLRAFWEFHLFLDLQFARALEAWDMPWEAYLARVSEADQRLI